MKAYEVLILAKPIIERLVSAEINPKDVQYLDIYSEYNRLKAEGHKVTWIVSVLSDEYDVSEPNVYNIVKRFDKDI